MKGDPEGRILLVLSVTTLASLLTGFNARLAIVGLPALVSELSIDLNRALWITQGYMLGSTVIQLIVGRLSDVYGRVKLFNSGFLLFSAGALISGLALSPYQVILGRIVQGVGGAFLMTLSITLLTDYVPRERLSTWLGVNQVAWRAGALAGLSLGGFIIDALGWRWLFLLQAPLGIASYFVSRRRLLEIYVPNREPLDLAGFALFTSFAALLSVGLTIASYGAWDAAAIALLSLSATSLALFVIWELRSSSPALDLKVFEYFDFSSSIAAQTLYSLGFGATMILLSIFFQSALQYSAVAAGVALIPFEASYLVSGLLGGYVASVLGLVPTATAGLLIASGGLALLSRGVYAANAARVLLGEAVFGIGTGLFTPPNTTMIMSSVPPERRGVASSIRTLSFNVGFTASLNLAVLSMSSYMPYGELTKLIALSELGPLANQGNSLGQRALCQAMSAAFAGQAVLMALASAPTLVKMWPRRRAPRAPRAP